MTAPQLFAAALREHCPSGPNRCFYCGGACAEDYRAREYVKDTFTNYSGVACVGSPWVCGGCVAAMVNGRPLAGYDKLQKTWTFSWVVTEKSADHYTKANIDVLAKICLSPPEPSYAIVLADSGQKHQLYLAPVNHDRRQVSLILETQRIDYAVNDLFERMKLCSRIVAATSKPALRETPDIRLAIQLSNYWSDWEALLATWTRVCGEPLSRLAAFLCPNKERSAIEYPTDIITASPNANAGRGAIPPEASGAGGRDAEPGGLFG